MPTAAIQEPEDKAEFNQLFKSNDLVAVKFYATWCGPCKIMGPKFKKLAEEFAPKGVVFAQVDADEHEPLLKKYDIEAMPSFLMFRSGELVDRAQGTNEARLRELLERLVSG